MRRKDLLAMVAKWQPLLKLQDWVVASKSVPLSKIKEETGDESWGCVETSPTERQIMIFLCRSKEWPVAVVPEATSNEEETFIHEFLHTYFPERKDPAEDQLQEQGLNVVARLLYRYSRGLPVD